MENNYSIEFIKAERIFKVYFYDDVSEATIKSCFDEYEKLVENNIPNIDFKLIINNSGYRPTCEAAHRLIRTLFENQHYKINCIKVAIVNDKIPVIERRKEIVSKKTESFFTNEEEAILWLCNK